MKVLINNEEVICGKDFTIEQEMLNTPSVILNNVYPASWEEEKDYVSNFYYPEDYSKCLIYDGEQIDDFEILGETSQNGTPTPDNPIPIVNKTGTITETIEGKDYTFDLGDIELCKIGSYQDKIYKSNDKWYLHKEVSKVVLNGSESWDYTSGARERFTTSINDIELQPFNSTAPIVAISNYFVGTTWYNLYNNTNLDNALSSHNSVHQINLRAKQFLGNTSDFTNWLSSNNTTVYYALSTPTNTEITDTTLLEQLESVGYGLIFAGVVENTGNISLNPREPHYCNLQILDFKTFLSEGETLDFVIADKTITQAIEQVVNTISDYGFVVGNVQILNPNEVIGAYSTKDKTAYDVFQYIADITQSRWTTRMIDADTVAIDFYDPTLMPEGTTIEYTTEWFETNDIHDMTFSYASRDYRNKQIMTSDEVYGGVIQKETIVANGYQTQFNTSEKIGEINSIKINGVSYTFTTKENKELGVTADFYYAPGETYFESNDLQSAGTIIIIEYTPIVLGRQIIINSSEIERISASTGRKGTISRYENRNDATTSYELQQIGKSYIKYKGSPEVTLTIVSSHNIWDVGETVDFDAPLDELSTTYMVKKKTIRYIVTGTQKVLFYTYEMSSSFNSETEINYFDNQRAKTFGNIGAGEYIPRQYDIESSSNIIFYDTEFTEVTTTGDNILDSILDSPFNN